MTSEQKKILLLLKAVIFQYHGLDNDEIAILEATADKCDGRQELEWALEFIKHDDLNALSRAREFFNDPNIEISSDLKMDFLTQVWHDNNIKGYITELEATGMLKVAKDWGLQSELLNLVRSRAIK